MSLRRARTANVPRAVDRSTTRAIPTDLETFFKKYDVDEHGSLSLSEFQHALRDIGLSSHMASIIFFKVGSDHQGRIDKHEFVALHGQIQKPLTTRGSKPEPKLHQMAKQVAGEPHYLQELKFSFSQNRASHLAAFFNDADGGHVYVKFIGIPSIDHDDEQSKCVFDEMLADPKNFKQTQMDKIRSKSEVLVSKLYGMAGVEAAVMRFVTIEGAEEDGPLGLWSRTVDCHDLDPSEMIGLPGLKEGFAADAWLANWDVIGSYSDPGGLNMKRQKSNGRAFRRDFGGCMQYQAHGGNKADPPTSTPFGPDSVPEIINMRTTRYNPNNHVFSEVSASDIRAGVAKIAAGAPDDAIRDVVQATMGKDSADIADILIGRKNVLLRFFPPPITMKLSVKHNVGFYTRAAIIFLKGTKEKKPVPELCITALGLAINTACAVATRMERDGLGKITKISTAYPPLKSGHAEHGCAQIRIAIIPAAPGSRAFVF